MKPGDLVRILKHGGIGIITEIFDDLNPNEPWVRVLFTHPAQTYQWCKASGLELLKKDHDHTATRTGHDASGSL